MSACTTVSFPSTSLQQGALALTLTSLCAPRLLFVPNQYPLDMAFFSTRLNISFWDIQYNKSAAIDLDMKRKRKKQTCM